ncbi:hypothetical protein [Clostridium botulinum]|nr:hypothetical protein [Clostridium botulinum]
MNKANKEIICSGCCSHNLFRFGKDKEGIITFLHSHSSTYIYSRL